MTCNLSWPSGYGDGTRDMQWTLICLEVVGEPDYSMSATTMHESSHYCEVRIRTGRLLCSVNNGCWEEHDCSSVAEMMLLCKSGNCTEEIVDTSSCDVLDLTGLY